MLAASRPFPSRRDRAYQILSILPWAVQGSGALGNWLAAHLIRRSADMKASEVRAMLEQLGCAAEPDIRKPVESPRWNARVRKAEFESLIALLVNLTRGARFVTTQGIPKSASARRRP